MARGLGRVIVAKIDQNGKKIKGSLAAWIAKHPGEMYFDSTPEWEVWSYMCKYQISHIYEKELVLFAGCETTEFKNGKIVKVKQREIKYTPDYYLPEYDVYIEVKGWADELFKVRWKLFKIKGYNGYLVYSLDDFIAVLKLLEESTN